MKCNNQKCRIFLYALSISFFFTNSCSDSVNGLLDELKSKNIEWTQNNSIVCYGNSLTSGVISADSSYPAFLDELLEINVINNGRSGATTQYGVDHINDIFDYNPVLVILEFGANDYFNGDSLSQTSNNLIEMINRITDYGAEVALLNFGNSEMIDCLIEYSIVKENLDDDSIQELIDIGLEYVETINLIALEYNLLYEDYLFEGISCDTTLLSWDGIHPNGKGNMKMAQNVYDEFYDIFKISGMLK